MNISEGKPASLSSPDSYFGSSALLPAGAHTCHGITLSALLYTRRSSVGVTHSFAFCQWKIAVCAPRLSSCYKTLSGEALSIAELSLYVGTTVVTRHRLLFTKVARSLVHESPFTWPDMKTFLELEFRGSGHVSRTHFAYACFSAVSKWSPDGAVSNSHGGKYFFAGKTENGVRARTKYISRVSRNIANPKVWWKCVTCHSVLHAARS